MGIHRSSPYAAHYNPGTPGMDRWEEGGGGYHGWNWCTAAQSANWPNRTIRIPVKPAVPITHLCHHCAVYVDVMVRRGTQQTTGEQIDTNSLHTDVIELNNTNIDERQKAARAP